MTRASAMIPRQLFVLGFAVLLLPAPAELSGQTEPQIITTAEGEPYDCRYLVAGPNTLPCGAQRYNTNSALSPYNGMVGTAANYQRLAEVCGDPTAAEVREDALARLSSASLLAANYEEIVELHRATYEADDRIWSDERQNVETSSNWCEVQLPRQLRAYQINVEAVEAEEAEAASATSLAAAVPTAVATPDGGTSDGTASAVHAQLEPMLEDAFGVSLSLTSSNTQPAGTSGAQQVDLRYSVDGGELSESGVLDAATSVVENLGGTVVSSLGAPENPVNGRSVVFSGLAIAGQTMTGQLGGFPYNDTVVFQGAWGGQSRARGRR